MYLYPHPAKPGFKYSNLLMRLHAERERLGAQNMKTFVHEKVKPGANLQTLINGQTGKHVIHFTNGRKKVLTANFQREMTEQNHAKECDLNWILRKYQKTGVIDHVRKHQGRYDDVSVTDFTDAMHTVSEAQNMYNELPSFIQMATGGSVEKFLELVQNPDNKDELARLGLLAGNDGVNARGEAVASPQEESHAEGATGDSEPKE
jgi:hypothetical protein